MKSALTNVICRFLAVALMMLPFHNGQAGMIGTDQVNTDGTAQSDRAVVLNFLSRAQTASEFQALGLDAQAAMDRVAAMTDDEVSTLAGKVNAVPAGGVGPAAGLLVLLVFATWWFGFRR
ncbi:MAG: PA2779 family protein [Betaproteobacteria bacterium]|nr:PA2779 family protein [Betaproteobacteria bacterium]